MGRWDDFTVDEVKFIWVALRSLATAYMTTCALLPVGIPRQVLEDMEIVCAMEQECAQVIRQSVREDWDAEDGRSPG